MKYDEICALVESLASTWNSRDLDGFVSLLADDVVWDDPAMEAPAVGREAVRRFSEMVLRAFPDFHYAILHPICVAADSSMCAVHWRITGTQLGPFDPPGFGPTGQRADSEGVDLLEFRGGKVSRILTIFNVLPVLEQVLSLRLRPSPGSLRERIAVFLQRLRAAWLRAR